MSSGVEAQHEPRSSAPTAANLIRLANKIAVISHVNPDADAIGSILGLTHGFRTLGKTVVPVLTDPVPEYALFLTGASDIAKDIPEGTDLIVCADAAGIDRVGAPYNDAPDRFTSVPIVNLDHHRTNPLFGTVNIVDGSASSTSELALGLLRDLGVSLDADTANALLFGIVGDTGSFRNGATTPGSLEAAAALVRLGGDVQRIAFQIFERTTFAAAQLWGRIIAGIELDRSRRIVFAYMSQAMLREAGATSDETEGVAEHLRGVIEAEVVVLMKETEAGDIRISMRSRPAVDVAVIASALGGGGHRQAAGCTIPGPVDNARKLILETYDRLVEASNQAPA